MIGCSEDTRWYRSISGHQMKLADDVETYLSEWIGRHDGLFRG